MTSHLSSPRRVHIILIPLLFLALAALIIPAHGLADERLGGETTPCPEGKVCLPNPLGSTSTVDSLLRRIVNWLVTVAAPIAAIMIIYGAFQMLFAGGDPEKFGTGRKTILYAVVGYGIIFIGWGLVFIIEKLLTTNP